jgi:hypothetical protein
MHPYIATGKVTNATKQGKEKDAIITRLEKQHCSLQEEMKASAVKHEQERVAWVSK